MPFGKKSKKVATEDETTTGSPIKNAPNRDGRSWRLIYNPEGDPADVVAYGAAVAEGRIAGKYQLSNIKVPNTVIVQRSRVPGIIVGADVRIDRDLASRQGIAIARTQQSGTKRRQNRRYGESE